MSEFRNVTVVRQANIYFDGKVTSRTVLFPDGAKKKLGIMLPGEYEFNTGDKEIIEVLRGRLEVLLPQTKNWQSFCGGQLFEVPARSKFGLRPARIKRLPSPPLYPALAGRRAW
jgi:uncharacterized protein YaiE (UPF0345 family)